VALVKERTREIPSEKSIIFDGFPRTVAQAEAHSRALPEVGRVVDAVVVLEAPDDVLVKRIAGRRSCPRCGRVFNVYFNAPRREGLCDSCGDPLDHRPDDMPDTVRHRLEVYKEMTAPLIAYYEGSSAPVLRVDGSLPLEVVQEAVVRSLAGEVEIE
jgi:adenylate kinase